MEVKITLNGKMIKDTVDADMLLIDFCRKHKCYSVKRGVKQETVVFARCLWMESRCFRAVFLSAGQTEDALIHLKDWRKKLKNLPVILQCGC